MTDCPNTEMRDALPDYLHGALDDVASVRVRAHLGVCADCTAELRLLHAVLETAPASPVDVARIVAAIPAYRAPTSRWGWSGTVALRLAAAVLIAAAGVSTVTMARRRDGGSAQRPRSPAASSSGLALVGVGELSDDGLEELIASMDHLEAAPTAEPEPMSPAEVGGGV